VVIGGDLLELASSLDIDVQIVVMEKYFKRLCEQTRLIVSSGNHDGNSRNTANESVARWLQEAKTNSLIGTRSTASATAPELFVDGDSVQLGETLITVCPWWDGPVSRAELKAQLQADAARPKKQWIWIHHAPPDHTSVSWTGKKFCGDEFLVDWIKDYQPDIVLSGHIHNAPFYPGGSWIDRLGKTWIFNPGRQIGPCPTSLSIDLDKMTVSWVSLEGEQVRELNAAPTSGVAVERVPTAAGA
jgi:hypothetical protein